MMKANQIIAIACAEVDWEFECLKNWADLIGTDEKDVRYCLQVMIFIADETLPKKRVAKRRPSINTSVVSPVRDFNEGVSDSDSVLMGIDLAWLSDKNGSGLAVGVLSGREITVTDVYTGVIGYDHVVNIIDSVPGLAGLAIDAPLIINNNSGKRPCEKALNAVYSKKVGWVPPV